MAGPFVGSRNGNDIEIGSTRSFMRSKINYISTSTATLTQSGLLAELLQHQRRKVMELTQRRAQREQVSGFFGASLSWLLTRAHGITAGRRFRRGFGEDTLRQHI